MKILISFTYKLLLFVFLTFLTQVGGLIYLLYLPLGFFLQKKIEPKLLRILVKTGSFLSIYLFFALIIIPPLAKINGRVQLSYFANEKMPIKPRNVWSALTNRNYVKAELLAVVQHNALLMQEKYPEAEVVYFESGFPFWDGYPLLPHRSHDDGRKIDLAFFYRNKKDRTFANTTPHWFGYGISEEPQSGEYDRPAECAEKGYRWYSFIRNYLISQDDRKNYIFNEQATADFIRLLCNDKKVGMILIEPHLKQRLGLEKENKIRLHGCNAVRHDDHIHVKI
jgi:hypothetical protein